ncbi:MAG: family 78 glycoside hydrolase catalytic domain, partial [Eubacteriales bacterium]|nr:family 78 glycoside hydrolase catalytic domain [Eubacteriales bacterium]
NRMKNREVRMKMITTTVNLRFLIVVYCVFCSFYCMAAKPKSPTNLRIQEYTEQIGVDVDHPHFAWYVSDTDRNESQTSYRILVASTLKNLNANKGDMWDSGKVPSAGQYNIKYNGSKLESSTRYFWKVMTWDKKDKKSPWSENKSFITGLFSSSDWAAHWIKSKTETPSVPYMLRKQFFIDKNIDYALVNISGIGHFELRLNGKKVGDHELDPGWTEYAKSQQYVVFDVTNLIKNGSNAMGVWLADGFMDLRNSGGRSQLYSENYEGAKRMIMELVIKYKDGSKERIISDGSWKTSYGPITYSNYFGGEDYDAQKEKNGWDSPDYDDSGWENAVITGSPGGILRAQSQPPLKVVEVLDPVSKVQKGDTIELNFGKTFAGIFDISLSGKAGQTVILTLDDGTKQFNNYCKYTLKGNGIETFRPHFFYFGQNKITVKGASLSDNDISPKLHGIKGYVLSSAATTAGEFISSDSMYNRIFAINKQGITSNLYSSITDCPHREKAAWMNDINFTMSSFAAIYDMHTLFAKINQDISDSQHEDGWIPGMAPFYRDPKNPADPFHRSPFYDISSMRFPWTMYQLYGDKIILQKQYDVAKRSLEHLISNSSGYFIDYGLGDWLSPDPVSREFIETCVYYDFVVHMRQWAEIIDKPEDAYYFADLSIKIKNAFNAKHFNFSTHSYGTQQTANTVPLHHGMCPSGEEMNVFNALVNSIIKSNYTINCGQNAHGYMLQVLSDYGRDDLVGRIHTNTNGPSYGHWITMGKTNTPENWDGSLSQQHHMNNTFPEWICKNLAGITNLKPGFEVVRIRPTSSTTYVPKMVFYSLKTVKGEITSKWEKHENEYELNVTIPVNCKAFIHIPTFGKSGVTIGEGQNVLWKDGQPFGKSKDIIFTETEGIYPSNNNYIIFSIGSGTYKFNVKW